MPNLPLASLASGTRQAGRWQTAAHWLCRGLRIATGARPPRLTRGACRRIIVSPPQVVARQPAGAAFGSDGIALRHILHGASWGRHCWLCRIWRVPAHPPASLAGAGTYLPCWVCSCQGCVCWQFQLDGSKILKNAFGNVLIFCG